MDSLTLRENAMTDIKDCDDDAKKQTAGKVLCPVLTKIF